MAEHANGWKFVTSRQMRAQGIDGAHVRYRQDEQGRWVVTDLYVHVAERDELNAMALRSISLARLEARANAPDAIDPGSDDDDGLTVAELRNRGREIVKRETGDDAKTADSGATWDAGGTDALGRPDGSDPEAFYRRVAELYSRFAEETNAPAKALAVEARVPVTTAHRWVREARRRGFLPAGRKGRAG